MSQLLALLSCEGSRTECLQLTMHDRDGDDWTRSWRPVRQLYDALHRSWHNWWWNRPTSTVRLPRGTNYL